MKQPTKIWKKGYIDLKTPPDYKLNRICIWFNEHFFGIELKLRRDAKPGIHLTHCEKILSDKLFKQDYYDYYNLITKKIVNLELTKF